MATIGDEELRIFVLDQCVWLLFERGLKEDVVFFHASNRSNFMNAALTQCDWGQVRSLDLRHRTPGL